MAKNLRILFLGPAGSGKGTQSVRIAEKFGIEHISTGDLIRAEIKSGSDLGNQVKSIVESGKLVSDDIVNAIVKSKISKLDSFILDGYPRTLEQAKFLQEFTEFDFIFDLVVPRETLFERLTGRRMCTKERDPNCKGNYHLKFSPPQTTNICDLCGSPLYQRKDDTEEAIDKRLSGYEAETGKPLNDFYGSKVKTVDATRNPDKVFEELIETIAVAV